MKFTLALFSIIFGLCLAQETKIDWILKDSTLRTRCTLNVETSVLVCDGPAGQHVRCVVSHNITALEPMKFVNYGIGYVPVEGSEIPSGLVYHLYPRQVEKNVWFSYNVTLPTVGDVSLGLFHESPVSYGIQATEDVCIEELFKMFQASTEKEEIVVEGGVAETQKVFLIGEIVIVHGSSVSARWDSYCDDYDCARYGYGHGYGNYWRWSREQEPVDSDARWGGNSWGYNSWRGNGWNRWSREQEPMPVEPEVPAGPEGSEIRYRYGYGYAPRYRYYRESMSTGDITTRTKCTLRNESTILECIAPTEVISCGVVSNFTGLGSVRYELYGIGEAVFAEGETTLPMGFHLYPRTVDNTQWLNYTLPVEGKEVNLCLHYEVDTVAYGIRVESRECYQRLYDLFKLATSPERVEVGEQKTMVPLVGEILY